MNGSNDFSPIVEQGDLEATSGVLGRLRRRQELGPVGSGLVRILLNEEGTALVAAEQLSAGQKYWARTARSWVKVDVSEHVLNYEVPFTEPSGRAGLVAALAVRCSVSDPAVAAQQGVRRVRDFLESALQDEVARASSQMVSADSSDPVAVLGDLQRNADAALKEALRGDGGQVEDLPSWLQARVTSVTVRLDAATAEHRDVLVKQKRRGELIDLAGHNEQKEKANAMKVRAIVRDSLGEHLANPAMNSFEVVFADPSPENISAVVGHVNAANHELILNVLQNFTENDLIDKDDKVFNATAEALINAMKGTPFQSAGMLGGSEPAPEIGAADDDADDGDSSDTIEGEPPITETDVVDVDLDLDAGNDEDEGDDDEGDDDDKNWDG